MTASQDISFATEADRKDELKHYRQQFRIPLKNGREQIYLLGNSLGLQPVSTAAHLDHVLEQWADWGVEGFFYGSSPWMQYHDSLTRPLSKIIGALPGEVVVMNQLTVNLHLMLVSFYRPSGKRKKILCEAKAFPSDQYMLQSHLRHHGYDPTETLLELAPRVGETTIRTEDIVSIIGRHRDELALVLWGGVNYYTGQVFDMQAITAAAHRAGALAGFDLAHAAGNVRLDLHDWDVDFACWCSYKYLNSGPGAVGGAFIHERYHHDHSLHRFAGWWGHDKTTRFKMEPGFVPEQSAEGWQLSTPPILLYAAHRAALEIFESAGMDALLAKSHRMGHYLRQLLQGAGDKLQILTPADSGCQLSLRIHQNGRTIFDRLKDNGIFADWREPDVIRVAPVPLYNTFTELWQFAQIIKKLVQP